MIEYNYEYHAAYNTFNKSWFFFVEENDVPDHEEHWPIREQVICDHWYKNHTYGKKLIVVI